MLILTVKEKDLLFEHSLVSLSEWEAEYEKPFFSKKSDEEKTEEEMIRYFQYMCVSNYADRDLVYFLSEEQQLLIAQYINATRSATIVHDISQKKGPQETVTSELIYYWMIAFKIPFKPADEWHLNRLLMLIRVCSVKEAPPSKRSKAEIAKDYRAMNEQRRKELGTSG